MISVNNGRLRSIEISGTEVTHRPGVDRWTYDAFISYARVDERFSGLISKIANEARTIFRSLTGRELRLFLDREEISTASLWGN